jgi:hypothetical protein
VVVQLPPLSAMLYRAVVPVPCPTSSATSIRIIVGERKLPLERVLNEAGHEYRERIPVTATMEGQSTPGFVRFSARTRDNEWKWLGDAMNPPYRLYCEPSLMETDSKIDFRAEFQDIMGNSIAGECFAF